MCLCITQRDEDFAMPNLLTSTTITMASSLSQGFILIFFLGNGIGFGLSALGSKTNQRILYRSGFLQGFASAHDPGDGAGQPGLAQWCRDLARAGHQTAALALHPCGIVPAPSCSVRPSQSAPGCARCYADR